MSFDPCEFDRGYASSMGDTLGQYTAKTFLWMVLGLLVTFGVAVGCWVTGAIFFIVRAFSYVHLVVLIATLVLALSLIHI